MYARFHELSRLVSNGEPWEMLNEGMPEVYDRGMALCFDGSGAFAGVRSYRKRDAVYRSGPPNGTDLTPCCKLGPKRPKTLRRLRKATAVLHGFLEDGDAAKAWLESILSGWQEKDDPTLLPAFEAHAESEELSQEHRGYLFVARLDEAGIEPLYATAGAKACLVAKALERFDAGTRQKGTCCVCGATEQDVLGRFSVLPCYSLDRQGAIAGGFDAKHSPARNFPVCEACAVPVANAISFAQSQLKARTRGIDYFVLPSAATDEARDWLLEGLESKPERFQLSKTRDLLVKEEGLLDEMAAAREDGVRDHLSFSLVFFLENKGQWNILGEVQQVLPSRVRAIWDASEDIARDPLLAGSRNVGRGKARKTETVPLRITTGLLSDFAGEALGPSHRTLREWLAALFGGTSVDRRALLHQIVGALLATWRKEPDRGHYRTRQAWGLYRFARQTGLIEGGTSMKPSVPDSPYGAYCAEHADFFDRPEKVAAFLTGCFCSVVASVQRKKRGASPFTKKYQGRLLNDRHLRRLYHEGRDKLGQYDSLGLVARSLDPDLAEAFVRCGTEWGISDDEATFAFHVGLSLRYRIQAASKAAEGEAEPE